MVSFSNEEEAEGRVPSRRRSFKGLMELVWGNKRSYAEKMGYDFIDARELVDRDRPPNWSKILAVRFYLDSYHWIFWNDAVSYYPTLKITNINYKDLGMRKILIGCIGVLLCLLKLAGLRINCLKKWLYE